MPRNVEIKARVESIAAMERLVKAMATRGPEEIAQDDTFFRCEGGRLKLRDFGDGRGELIFYRRADAAGPKESQYWLSPTSAPVTLRETLGRALGVVGRVKKRRTLYLIDPTRVHLDRVEGLGEFLELEVVLADGQPVEEGQRIAADLMERLRIPACSLTEGAYLDLLRERS